MEKIVVKLGGSVITFKDVGYFPLTIDEIEKNADKYIRWSCIKILANEIYSANIFPLILVHGAGPFGHYLVEYQERLKRKEIIHESVSCLNKKIVDYFKKLGVKIKSFSPYGTCVYLGNGKFETKRLFEEGKEVLEENGIMVTYGDIIPTAKGVKGNCDPYQVISGDDLMIYLAEAWGAEKIITVTDVDGYFNKDPKVFNDAVLIREIRSGDKIEVTKSNRRIDVTGEMLEKIRKLQTAAKKGIKSQIINGFKEDNLRKALLGDESIGTLILP